MMLLGVNIDHVATVRQARGTDEPDPVHLAVLAEVGGADQITVHLREDRRHIQERDVRVLRDVISTRLNLETSLEEDSLAFAADIHPEHVCLVPERRDEVTTEAGLDVVAQADAVEAAVVTLKEAGALVAVFVDPDADQIDAVAQAGADAIELHTGSYASARTVDDQRAVLVELERAARVAHEAGLRLHLGHGVTYRNVTRLVRKLNWAHEINIGHSIVARALFTGMTAAVAEMKTLIRQAIEEADRLQVIHRLPG